jgi:hypothetical protein
MFNHPDYKHEFIRRAKKLTIKQAREWSGHASGLGRPSKMPGFSTSLPAKECKNGAKLRKVKGSVCEGCYAYKGNYGTPSVQKGLYRRFTALLNSDEGFWLSGMYRLISHQTDPNDPYFRIHDSGDFQSVEHVLRWVRLAKLLPWVKFWAPSKEYAFIRKAMKLVNDWPENLVIRLSAPMLGADGAKAWKRDGIPYSTVDHGKGHECPAPTQGNQCGDCRACWDILVPVVDYHKH